MSSGSGLLSNGIDVCLYILVSTAEVELLVTVVVQTYKIGPMIRSLG